MTQYEGIRTASETELEEGLHILGDQLRASEAFSPIWKATSYWIGRIYAELERRQRDDWGNGFGFMTRDYGDEAEQ